MISLLVAASENNVIGVKNQLPWHLPNDMKYFKNTTWGMPVVMGRKTFESFKASLPGRINIVITRNSEFQGEGAIVVNNLDSALRAATDTDAKEIYVIGGGEIFREAFYQADRVYMTRVHTILEGDTFFPAINESDWNLSSNRDFFKDEKHAFDYSFQVWDRRR